MRDFSNIKITFFVSVLLCSACSNLFGQGGTFDNVRLTGTSAFQPFIGFLKPGSEIFFIDGLEDSLVITCPDGRDFLRIGADALDEGLVVDGNGVFVNDRLRVVNGAGTTAIREVVALENNGGSTFTFSDSSNGSKWFFGTDAGRRFNISLDGTGGPELTFFPNGRVLMGPGPERNFDLRANGDLIIAGALSESSDKAKKTDFKAVDSSKVLEKVAKLPVTTWRYKTDASENRHMGPTAQDFHSAFKLGSSDKTIAAVDRIGVSLAAIKGLNQKVETLEDELGEKDDRIAELEDRLDRLEAALMNSTR